MMQRWEWVVSYTKNKGRPVLTISAVRIKSLGLSEIWVVGGLTGWLHHSQLLRLVQCQLVHGAAHASQVAHVLLLGWIEALCACHHLLLFVDLLFVDLLLVVTHLLFVTHLLLLVIAHLPAHLHLRVVSLHL